MTRPLTVSIVTYNGAGKITKCLQSLHAQTFEDFDVIVVDNASTDGTLAEVTSIAPEAKIMPMHTNTGFGAGHNLAIRSTESPFILVLNQDIVLHEQALQEMMDAAEAHDEAGAVGPCLYRGEGAKPEEIIDTVGLRKSFFYQVTDRGAGKEPTRKLLQAGYLWGVSGACMLLRRTAIDSIAYRKTVGTGEYFDESFFMYKEDVDLCARLHRKGWRSWYEPSAVGWHTRTGFAAASLAETPRHRQALPRYVKEYSYRNHCFFLLKNAPLLLLPFIFMYEALKFVYLVIFETKTLRVIPRVIRSLPLMLRRRYANSR